VILKVSNRYLQRRYAKKSSSFDFESYGAEKEQKQARE